MGKYDILASNIKMYRKKKSLTQKELGEKIHKKEITIRKYESGDTKIPFPALLDICRALDIMPNELFWCDDVKLIHDLVDLYPEFNEDIDKFLLSPTSYDFVTKFKNGDGDYLALFNSLISYVTQKNNIDIDLYNLNRHERTMLYSLIESLIKDYCLNILFKQSQENKI